MATTTQKSRTVFVCEQCGADAPRWEGRCPSCGEWNTMGRVALSAGARSTPRLGVPVRPEPALPIDRVPNATAGARATGLVEVDRVLSGGLVPGGVTLLGGEPGVGKSTLLLQAALSWAGRGGRALYISAEEAPAQIRARAERLAEPDGRCWVAGDAELGAVVAHLDDVRPDLLVIDSIQAVHDTEIGSPAGSVAQVRACTQALVEESRRRAIATVLIGQVTKDGALAGPRVLEHLVDTVLAFEGDRHHALRLLRAVKHRFGSTAELGVFELGERGLQAVPDPSGLFLADRRPGVSGSTVVPALQGHRPLLVEVQALVAGNKPVVARRSAEGVDGGRLALLLAVLERHGWPGIGEGDVFALAAGGVRVEEPAADLALALAAISSATKCPVPPDMVVVGEVGLGGEVRQVGQTERRLVEAARLGFARAIVPAAMRAGPPGIELLRAADIGQAACMARLVTG